MARIALNKIFSEFVTHDLKSVELKTMSVDANPGESSIELEGRTECCKCKARVFFDCYVRKEDKDIIDKFELFYKDGIIPPFYEEIDAIIAIDYINAEWWAQRKNIIFEGYSCANIISMKQKVAMLEALE